MEEGGVNFLGKIDDVIYGRPQRQLVQILNCEFLIDLRYRCGLPIYVISSLDTYSIQGRQMIKQDNRCRYTLSHMFTQFCLFMM